MKQNLVQHARELRLSGLLSSLELRLEEARVHQLLFRLREITEIRG
jgi:hypothetical protein